jgi:hypothetical protein
MTSPTGGEHISRYRALGEFDNLIREANKARRALRELREEEAKLNAQSMADDKKVAASKAERAKAEQTNLEAAKKATSELNRGDTAGKAGESAGTSYTKGMGRGIQKGSQSPENRRFVEAATNALKAQFDKAGSDSGVTFQTSFGRTLNNTSSSGLSSVLARKLREMKEQAGPAGADTGNRYVMGFASKIRDLNNILPLLGQDKLDLDVDVKDAEQSMKALEIELKRLSNITAEPRVRIDSTRALTNLRAIQKLFKDELAEDIIKESRRIQDELKVIDTLPSGKAFKFWALTALSDMSRVYSEANKGVGIFERLRRSIAASGGGGGGNYFKTVISGFDDFSEASSKLLQRLGRVSGELYRMPGLIGVLVSALPALVAGVAALGGGALAAGSALGALSGLLAAGPGVAFAFIGAIGGVSNALSGMGDILKNAREALDQEAEAKEKSRLGTEKALTAAQKYELALRNLDPATQKVTESFVDFSTKYAEMQKRIGERFFKQLADDTERFNKVIPIAENFFGKSATAVGKLADEGLRMVTSGPWKRDFAIIAKNNADVIDNLGKAGFGLANVFRNIAVAAGPFTDWLTTALREGAQAFADWSAQARSDGTIVAFLDETKESAQILWQILKNLGNVVTSFFKATVDEGQAYLTTLEGITDRWADVAKAQEAANSPLRKWLTDIRPVLSAMGALIGAVAKGIGELSSNQSNISAMIALLDSLRTRVLPPILDILQHLNDSGIAVTVTNALGTFLEAIAKFLDSGATTALSVFVTVLANFADIVFSFASLPVISTILGGLAASLAALAAVSIVARFTGLFKLWDFFTWMVRNKGNLSGAFADAARGAAGLNQVGGQQALPRNVPSTVSSIGGVGSEVIREQAKATEQAGRAAATATAPTNRFAGALRSVNAAGGVAKGALSGLSGFLGGPWGVALIAATAGIGLLISSFTKQKQEVQDTKDAFTALKNAYGDLQEGNTENVNTLGETNNKFREILDSANQYGLTLRSVSGALNNQEQDVTRVNTVLDGQIENLERLRIAAFEAGGPTAALPFKEQKDAAIAFKNSINEVANAQRKQNTVLEQASTTALTYKDRLGGMTQAQVDNVVQGNNLEGQIKTLSNALDVMSSASASSADRSRALSDIIQHETGVMESANEATESWQTQLFALEDAVKSNGRSLDVKSRAGLRNRDALQAAAKATRELYLQDIASGAPMDAATRKHQDRIKELKEEARRLGLGKKATQELIDTYGKVPDDVSTEIKSDKEGFAQVYADLMKLQVMQKALQEGKSIGEAQKDWVQESSKLYQRPPTVKGGDGYGAPGFRTGGPVWGAGTKTSDSIRAWLSNGEFVQPTDAVEHYGMPIMEALRTRKLDKAALNEALPDGQTTAFAAGGQAHSANCVACGSGGHKFADGGRVTWPFKVDPKNTMIKDEWVNQGVGGGLGQATGTGGVAWMMGVLRKQFPGLPLISGYRPGSRTLSGNRSYHSLNRAVDLPPRRDVAAWIRSNYGARTKELITPYNDLNLHNGRPHRYTGAIWNQHNFAGGNAHDHWAYKNGGLVDVMNMLGMDNLAPQKQSALPTTPRSLSPAASSVVNNSTDNARTFGDVIINNPMPERAGDSIRDALYRTQLLL